MTTERLQPVTPQGPGARGIGCYDFPWQGGNRPATPDFLWIDDEPQPLTLAMLKAARGYLRNRNPGAMASYVVIGTGDFPDARLPAVE